MWNFGKNNPRICTPCHEEHEKNMDELERRRRYILHEITALYDRIIKELGVADRETLETLHIVIEEYKELEQGIDAKLNEVDEKINSFVRQYSDMLNEAVKGVYLKTEYNPATKTLYFSIDKENA